MNFGSKSHRQEFCQIPIIVGSEYLILAKAAARTLGYIFARGGIDMLNKLTQNLKVYENKHLQETQPYSYLEYFPEVQGKYRKTKVVVFLRVSGREQDRQKNWRAQERAILEGLRPQVFVVGIYKAVASGWNSDREMFKRAVRRAKKRGAVIVAVSPDRYLRSVHFKCTDNPPIEPNVAEWKGLLSDAKGVKLCTLLHPNQHWTEVRAFMTKGGMVAKNIRYGRPRKFRQADRVDLRHSLMPKIARMQSLGFSYREIADNLRQPFSTIRSWVIHAV
jgi:hypothetical protein